MSGRIVAAYPAVQADRRAVGRAVGRPEVGRRRIGVAVFLIGHEDLIERLACRIVVHTACKRRIDVVAAVSQIAEILEEYGVGRHLRFSLRRHGTQLRPLRVDLARIVGNPLGRAALHAEIVGRSGIERPDDETVVNILRILVVVAVHLVGELAHHPGVVRIGIQQLPCPLSGAYGAVVVVPLHDDLVRIGTEDVESRRRRHAVGRFALHLVGAEALVAEFDGDLEEHLAEGRGRTRHGHARHTAARVERHLARSHRQAVRALARQRRRDGQLLAAHRTRIVHGDVGLLDRFVFGHVAFQLHAVDAYLAVFLHDGHLAVETGARNVQFGGAFDTGVVQRLDRHALRNDALVAGAARLVEREPPVARQIGAVQRPRHRRANQQLLVGLLVGKFQFVEIRRQTTRRIVVRAAGECQRRQQDSAHSSQFE